MSLVCNYHSDQSSEGSDSDIEGVAIGVRGVLEKADQSTKIKHSGIQKSEQFIVSVTDIEKSRRSAKRKACSSQSSTQNPEPISSKKLKQTLPGPPNIIYDKFAKAPGIGLSEFNTQLSQLALKKRQEEIESIIQTGGSSKSQGSVDNNSQQFDSNKKMATKKQFAEQFFALSYYFFSDVTLSKPHIQKLTKINQKLNNIIRKHDFLLNETKLNAILHKIKTNSPVYQTENKSKSFTSLRHNADNSSFYYEKYHGDYYKQSFLVNEEDTKPENLFNGKNESHALLIYEFNQQLAKYYNEQNFLSFSKKFEQEFISQFNKTPLPKKYRSLPQNVLFHPHHVNRFGIPSPLHISYSVGKPAAPVDKLEEAENAAEELRILVERYNKYKTDKEVTDDEMVLLVKLRKRNVRDQNLGVTLLPQVNLVPNRYFTKLFLSLRLDDESSEKLKFVQNLIQSVDVFKKNVVPVDMKHLHVTTSLMDLLFTRNDFNIIFAEQVSDLIQTFNKENVASWFGAEPWTTHVDNLKAKFLYDVNTIKLE